MTEAWLSIPEAVAVSGLSRRTILNWMNRGWVTWRQELAERGGVRRAKRIERESLRRAVEAYRGSKMRCLPTPSR